MVHQCPAVWWTEEGRATAGAAAVQRESEFPRNLGIGVCVLMDEGASLEPKPPAHLFTGS